MIEVFHVTNLLPMNMSLHYRLFISLCMYGYRLEPCMNMSLHYRLFISLCMYGYRLEPCTHTLSALPHLGQYMSLF